MPISISMFKNYQHSAWIRCNISNPNANFKFNVYKLPTFSLNNAHLSAAPFANPYKIKTRFQFSSLYFVEHIFNDYLVQSKYSNNSLNQSNYFVKRLKKLFRWILQHLINHTIQTCSLVAGAHYHIKSKRHVAITNIVPSTCQYRSEACSESCQKSRMKHFAEILSSQKTLAIFTKRSFLDF